jgi:hypothetical protein
MSDDFSDDLDTPSEADLEQCYGSKYLSAADLGDKKIKTRIGKIRKEPMRQQGGKPERSKFVIYFTTLDKPMVLNATNKNALVDKLGKVPADWVSTDVGLYTENTSFAGKPTKGLRLRVLGPAKTEAAPVKPAKSVSLEETLDDPIPEFDEAAE